MFRSDVHSYLYLVIENFGHLHVNIESNYETDGYHTKTKSTCYFFPRMWETVCYRKKMVMRKFAINQEKQNTFTFTPKHIKHDYVKTWNTLLKGFFPNWFSWVSNLYYIMFFKIKWTISLTVNSTKTNESFLLWDLNCSYLDWITYNICIKLFFALLKYSISEFGSLRVFMFHYGTFSPFTSVV